MGKVDAPIPILLGADCEVSHICPGGGVHQPADALLAQLPGVMAEPYSNNGYTNINDIGRRFSSDTGECHYKDLDHLESCTPICRGVTEFVTHVQALRANVQDAVQRHNTSADDASTIVAMFDNRCGRGDGAVSIGTHLNLAIPGRTWHEICSGRYPAVTGYYASAIAGIQLIAGLGCVGAANGRPHTAYQISQRSDFINSLLHVDTMGHPYRPMINIRREPECGPLPPRTNPIARLHTISLDMPLNDTALFVSSGMLGLVVAGLAAGYVAPHLILHQPIRALWQWSHDPDLNTRMPLANGKNFTLPEYFAALVEFVSENAAHESVVENADEAKDIVAEAGALADAFLEQRWDYAARRVDWVQKRSILKSLLDQDPALDWRSDEAAMIDQHYANTDPESGLYYIQSQLGEMEVRVSDDAVIRARREPPANTRSWGFVHLVRAVEASPAHRILSLNWDRVTLWEWGQRSPITVWFPDPTRATQRDCGHLFSGAFSVREIVRAMEKLGLDCMQAMESRSSMSARERLDDTSQKLIASAGQTICP